MVLERGNKLKDGKFVSTSSLQALNALPDDYWKITRPALQCFLKALMALVSCCIPRLRLNLILITSTHIKCAESENRHRRCQMDFGRCWDSRTQLLHSNPEADAVQVPSCGLQFFKTTSKLSTRISSQPTQRAKYQTLTVFPGIFSKGLGLVFF